MRLKTDVRDCFAMVELLTRGQDWPFHRHADAIVSQQLWAARRRRVLEASKRQRNQVHAVADLHVRVGRLFRVMSGCTNVADAAFNDR